MLDLLRAIHEHGTIEWTSVTRVLYDRAVRDGLVERDPFIICPAKYRLTKKGLDAAGLRPKEGAA